MTSEQIILDLLNTLPEEMRFSTINSFLSLVVKQSVDMLSQPTMEQLLLTIQPIDEASGEALSLLEQRLFAIYGI